MITQLNNYIIKYLNNYILNNCQLVGLVRWCLDKICMVLLKSTTTFCTVPWFFYSWKHFSLILARKTSTLIFHQSIPFIFSLADNLYPAVCEKIMTTFTQTGYAIWPRYQRQKKSAWLDTRRLVLQPHLLNFNVMQRRGYSSLFRCPNLTLAPFCKVKSWFWLELIILRNNLTAAE